MTRLRKKDEWKLFVGCDFNGIAYSPYQQTEPTKGGTPNLNFRKKQTYSLLHLISRYMSYFFVGMNEGIPTVVSIQ